VGDGFALYRRYAGIALRTQLQYRATLVTKTLGHFFVTAVEFFGIWALFSRFGTLRGWSLAEVGLIYGIVDTGFALADATSTGFDKVASLIKKGELDRVLLRPRSTVLQLLGYDLQLLRFGRLSQGLAVMAWAGASLGAWSAGGVALAAFAVAGTACLFFGVVVLQATSAFWTIESLEVWSAVTYGGVYAGQYPMPIYKRWFQRFLTAIVPLACTSYFPALAVLGRSDALLCYAGPAAGVAFLALSLCVWRFIGLRRYASTGS
jgi:ABC-2 type transport system permease protein